MKKLVLSLLLMSFAASGAFAQKPKVAEDDSTRCLAITKKGTQCRLERIEGKDYCSVHIANDPTVEQCKAKTNSGKQCTRAAKKDGLCKQHYNKQNGISTRH